MIRAGIAAQGLLVGNVCVLSDEELEELVLTGVGVVHDKTEALDAVAALEANHVLVQHGHDLHVEGGVLAEDVLRAQKTRLLGTVPVPLQGVAVVTLSNAGVSQHSAEDVKVHQGGGAIVIYDVVSKAQDTNY